MRYFAGLIIVFLFIFFCNDVDAKDSRVKNSKHKMILFDTDSLDVIPKFPGGLDSLDAFIRANLRMLTSEYEGTLNVTFLIDKNGAVYFNEIAGEIEQYLFRDSFRKLCKRMPKWLPGIKNGQKVRTLYHYKFDIIIR